MSQKKDRRIKRLQSYPIWLAIVKMLIIEFIILSFTVFICTLSVLGIANTLIINNANECHIVVQSVEENWKTESREELEKRLSVFSDSYADIDKIFIDDKNDVIAIFPQLKKEFDVETTRLLDTVGMVHFILSPISLPSC